MIRTFVPGGSVCLVGVLPHLLTAPARSVYSYLLLLLLADRSEVEGPRGAPRLGALPGSLFYNTAAMTGVSRTVLRCR